MSSNNNTSITLPFLQLQTAFRYPSLILGFILLIGGVLGNILNIITFIKVGNYKNNACSLYMFVRTFLDLYILLVGLITRILTTGFQMDFTLMNRLWCKMRLGFLDINAITTYTLICLQAIDAFICSSPSVAVRQKSNIRIARYLVIGTLCFWCIHEMPYFIFQDLVIVGGTPMCINTNTIFAQYRSYFVALCVVTIIPIIVISIFGFLTVRHMKTIAVTRTLSSLTRQTISMALFQIVAVLVFNGPYAAWQIYSIVTTNVVKDTYRRAMEQLIASFIATYGFGPYAKKKKINRNIPSDSNGINTINVENIILVAYGTFELNGLSSKTRANIRSNVNCNDYFLTDFDPLFNCECEYESDFKDEMKESNGAYDILITSGSDELKINRLTFRGLLMCDKINSMLKNSCFQIHINLKVKYI
ncbi:unnamed protein product [Adineta steineri]|uniref:G-protein coupled receptors family 1 profile domain-containing protein n=1 Tax=Adineta steineri TaxID=433720 RepID=A0A819KUR1_9BILA|nr:unnamed protein product [Adineta steineri]